MENSEPTEPMPGKAPGSSTRQMPPEEIGRKGGRRGRDESEEAGRPGGGSATVSGTTVEGANGGT